MVWVASIFLVLRRVNFLLQKNFEGSFPGTRKERKNYFDIKGLLLEVQTKLSDAMCCSIPEVGSKSSYISHLVERSARDILYISHKSTRMPLFIKKANLIKEENKLICHILFLQNYDIFYYVVRILYAQNHRQKNISRKRCRQDPILPIR